jgi:hypothetical protein
MTDSQKKLKQELKSLASKIKELKSHRKDRQADGSPGSGYVHGLNEARFQFRHKHVAYCLSRSRQIEQIDSGVGLNMEYVNWVIDSMKEDSKQKLYIVVNENLNPSQQAVQSGHAVAEFLKKNPHTQWSNGYLIYLKRSPNYQGNMMGFGPWSYGLGEYAEFKEPDLENKVTAYAVFSPQAEKCFASYKLL